MAIFTLTDKEKKARDEFVLKHKECRDKYIASGHHVGLPFPYVFTPTGIGFGVEVVCPYCGAKEDITDIDCW